MVGVESSKQLDEVSAQIDWFHSKLGIDDVTPWTTTSSLSLAQTCPLLLSSSSGSTLLHSNANPFAFLTTGPPTPTPSSLGKSDSHTPPALSSYSPCLYIASRVPSSPTNMNTPGRSDASRVYSTAHRKAHRLNLFLNPAVSNPRMRM
ncbi:hypothetical protein DFH29DRAFT_1083356 [Suillus ampliporus]|nr:hypothetical protein DFH29DRAFT_1083356 [Suillus ampliporus]